MNWPHYYSFYDKMRYMQERRDRLAFARIIKNADKEEEEKEKVKL